MHLNQYTYGDLLVTQLSKKITAYNITTGLPINQATATFILKELGISKLHNSKTSFSALGTLN
jgi:hypothetical protein